MRFLEQRPPPLLIAFFVIAVLGVASMAAAEPPAAGIADTPKGGIVPKPEPLVPRPFTLEDRYLDAARRADLEMLKTCLEKGVNPGAKDGFQRSALLLAARDGRSLDMVKVLRERGVPVDEPDVRGITPLGYAAGNGDLPIVAYLLDAGAVADRKDAQGQTPLMHAVLGGRKDTAARLIEEKANVDSQDRFGDTPLMGACSKGFEDIARLLVEKGADPSLTDQEGRTARERADATATYCRELP